MKITSKKYIRWNNSALCYAFWFRKKSEEKSLGENGNILLALFIASNWEHLFSSSSDWYFSIALLLPPTITHYQQQWNSLKSDNTTNDFFSSSNIFSIIHNFLFRFYFFFVTSVVNAAFIIYYYYSKWLCCSVLFSFQSHDWFFCSLFSSVWVYLKQT